MGIINWIESQSAFTQGLMASAIFGSTIWLMRKLLNKVGEMGSAFMKDYQKLLLTRHWLHKHYVKSDNLYLYTQGFNFIMLQTIRLALLGILIILFFLGVNSILNKNWLWVACSWFAFNAFLESYQWAKDSSNEKLIEKIDEDVKKELFEALPSNQNKQLKT